MYHIDLDKLNGKIVECRTTKEAIADDLGIDRSTLFRRIRTGTLRVGDIHGICNCLNLSREEAMDIFLAV